MYERIHIAPHCKELNLQVKARNRYAWCARCWKPNTDRKQFACLRSACQEAMILLGVTFIPCRGAYKKHNNFFTKEAEPNEDYNNNSPPAKPPPPAPPVPPLPPLPINHNNQEDFRNRRPIPDLLLPVRLFYVYLCIFIYIYMCIYRHLIGTLDKQMPIGDRFKLNKEIKE